MKRLTNEEVARVAEALAGLRLERAPHVYGVHLGRDGVYRANDAPFRGDPVGALALNRRGVGYVASTADQALRQILGRRVTKGFCPGISAGFKGAEPVSKAEDYLAGYALGRALWLHGGQRAVMRERAFDAIQRRKAETRRTFFGY